MCNEVLSGYHPGQVVEGWKNPEDKERDGL